MERLAQRLGRDLGAEDISVVPIGGAHAAGNFLRRVGPRGLGLEVAGLCDAREEAHFERALEGAGMGSDLTREDMERLGFYTCVEDLEDELIRCLGVPAVERVLAAEGDLASFRKFQSQPAQLDRPIDAQLRRFMGTRAGRKAKYARVLVDALDLSRIPRPLAGVLGHLRVGGP